ncbi:hypothetical protein Zmor_015970 [Zophobas morio]|uniref:Uncharacterized protein n=1 Tax=Zophobas morio TaxID=2755281 RepID=A0AA38IHY9_9CUCU|nr:hypothetical protein Zmor_015970 [Zophobas morio]
MRSSLVNLLLICIFHFGVSNTSNSEKVSSKNVTVHWYFGNETGETVATSNNFNKIFPEEEQVTVVLPSVQEEFDWDIPFARLLPEWRGLDEIKPGAFDNLPQLESFIVIRNNLTEIKTGTLTNLNISHIDLSSNSIIRLQQGAFKNISADLMELDNNQLTEILNDVFENVTIGNLSLTNNGLHTIAPEALSTIGLTSLWLFENSFEEINPEVFNMQELISLNLGFNSIKLLRPGDLRNLPELSELMLWSNELEEIPEGVFNATKLTYLDLSGNKIVKIASKAFDDMPELGKLDISFNNLTRWDNNWLSGAKSIAYISVGYNQITGIPDEAFKNYPGVKSIGLEGNRIRNISNNAFNKLEHVEVLDLSNNEIDNWNPNFLANVSIGIIDLSDNNLECIDGDLETVFRNSGSIYLENNPWNEECYAHISEFIGEDDEEQYFEDYDMEQVPYHINEI